MTNITKKAARDMRTLVEAALDVIGFDCETDRMTGDAAPFVADLYVLADIFGARAAMEDGDYSAETAKLARADVPAWIPAPIADGDVTRRSFRDIDEAIAELEALQADAACAA